MEATGAEKGRFSEEEQFYAYTEQSEESEVSTAGKVMWKTNIISVRKKTSDIHLPFVRVPVGGTGISGFFCKQKKPDNPVPIWPLKAEDIVLKNKSNQNAGNPQNHAP